MPKKGVAPQCKTCKNHPRSQAHRDACGTLTNQTFKTSGRVKKSTSAKPSSKTGLRRGKKEIEPVDTKALPEKWILGKTCLTCATIFTQTPMPEFQEGGKDFNKTKPDITRQLPHTSVDYPLCEQCLPWAWRAASKRYSVQKEVQELYGDLFQ